MDLSCISCISWSRKAVLSFELGAALLCPKWLVHLPKFFRFGEILIDKVAFKSIFGEW